MENGVVENKNKIRFNILLFIVLSYILSWSYFILKILVENNFINLNIPPTIEVLGGFGPALAAIVVTFVFDGLSGLNELSRRLFIWKFELKWYVIALFLQPLIWLCAIYINTSFGGQHPIFNDYYISKYIDFSNIISPIYLLIILTLALFTQFIFLLGEEIGWRGFLLPKLLTISNWLISSIIVGIAWAIWHIPLFLISNTTQSNISFSLYFIDLMASTFIFTWIFFHTKGSVLIAGMFHASINFSTGFFPILPQIAGSSSPYIIGIVIKSLIVSTIIVKHKSSINVTFTGKEGLSISRIGNAFSIVLGFFERIVENIYKDS